MRFNRTLWLQIVTSDYKSFINDIDSKKSKVSKFSDKFYPFVEYIEDIHSNIKALLDKINRVFEQNNGANV